MKRAIFLDRDGVINIDKGYLYKIEEFVFCRGIFELISIFEQMGYLIFIVTNQSGIGRGYYTKKDFLKLSNWMINRFTKKNIKITKLYYCPHSPEEKCKCRKPNNQMFEDAIEDFDINRENSWIIGDKISDIEAAKKSHIKNSILINKNNLNKTKANFIVSDIVEILNLIKKGKIII